MKNARNHAFKLLGLLAALHLSPAFAAGTVFQKAAPDGAVELSNIEDGDSAQVPLMVEASPAKANPTGNVVATTKPAARAKAKKPLKQTTANGEPDDAQATDAENTDVAEQDKTAAEEGTETAGNAPGNAGAVEASAGTSNAAAAGSAGYANAIGTGSGVVTSGSSTGSGTTGGGTLTTGTGTGTNTTAGTGSSTGTTTTPGGTVAGSGGTGGTTGTGTAGTDTASLEAALQRYRQLMLQNGSVQASNPALTRRYLMVDRATYRGMLGM